MINNVSETKLGATLTTASAFRPKLVIDVELTAPLPTLPPAKECGQALVVVRLHTEPIGMVLVDLAPDGCSPLRLGQVLWTACHEAINGRTGGNPRIRLAACPPQGLATGPSEFLARRARVLRNAPPITVVICTLGHRADQLTECLVALAELPYPRTEILVVDNAPLRGLARLVVDRLRSDVRVPLRYLAEPRPGLSRARNRAIKVVDGEILAWIDDDEIPDRHWLAEVACGFASEPEVSCVTGSIVPRVLNTQAQDWFEQWGGHVKGRGFQRAVFDLGTLGRQNPLYPLPPFGSGGNCAFRRSALLDVGGFDVALGAGTPSGGCEDTEMFARLLINGHRIVYQPSALVRHTNRETVAELEKQLDEYGRGLTAYFTALLMRDPRLIGQFARMFIPALRDLVHKESLSRAKMTDFPPYLRARQLRGVLLGPFAYLHSRSVQRHVDERKVGDELMVK
jgi:O-antigen biosynthesis protein